jgi:hypothetical protein
MRLGYFTMPMHPLHRAWTYKLGYYDAIIGGVSPGNLRTDAEVVGNLDEDGNKLFEEVIDVIPEIWTRDPGLIHIGADAAQLQARRMLDELVRAEAR